MKGRGTGAWTGSQSNAPLPEGQQQMHTERLPWTRLGAVHRVLLGTAGGRGCATHEEMAQRSGTTYPSLAGNSWQSLDPEPFFTVPPACRSLKKRPASSRKLSLTVQGSAEHSEDGCSLHTRQAPGSACCSLISPSPWLCPTFALPAARCLAVFST